MVSTAAFHARVRGSVPGLGGLKETKMFLPHPRVKVSIAGSLRDREVACSASDRQGSNFESCVWRTVSSQSSHHPQEVLLAQFSLYVHKGGLKPDSFHFHYHYYYSENAPVTYYYYLLLLLLFSFFSRSITITVKMPPLPITISYYYYYYFHFFAIHYYYSENAPRYLLLLPITITPSLVPKAPFVSYSRISSMSEIKSRPYFSFKRATQS